jgi:hypothetical protein
MGRIEKDVDNVREICGVEASLVHLGEGVRDAAYRYLNDPFPRGRPSGGIREQNQSRPLHRVQGRG